MELSAIIVSWNVREHLLRCLGSLRPELDTLQGPWEAIVVDNASTDGTVEAVGKAHPWARLAANAVNSGFPRAVNQGLSLASGEFLLILNPDTEVLPGALSELLEFARAHPRAAVVGPTLLYPDGSVQPSRRRFPTLWTAVWESTTLEYRWPRNAAARRFRMEDVPQDAPTQVDWLYGAALLLRARAAAEVGPMDEGYFMYSEELDWCRRLRSSAWEVWHCPRARIVHHEGQSSRQVRAERDILFHAARIRYFAKHHGPWAARALRAFLLLDYLYRSLEEAGKWLLGHRRPLRAQRLRGYLRLLRSGLSPASAARCAPGGPDAAALQAEHPAAGS